MCTIAILVGVTDAPVVVAANRDEMYARNTLTPRVLGPHLAGGVDAQSGGTWFAVHGEGRFAAVTNQRVMEPPPVGLRSRGLAVVELASATDPDAYVAALDPRAYASMNLVWGDADRVRVAYLRRETGDRQIETLPRGIHVLCNDRLGTPDFPRGDRLARMISSFTNASWPALVPQLSRALGDHTRSELADVPTSRFPPDIARELTAICIHTPIYGTRSASLLALDHGSVRGYLQANGSPCTTPFTDYRDLLT